MLKETVQRAELIYTGGGCWSIRATTDKGYYLAFIERGGIDWPGQYDLREVDADVFEPSAADIIGPEWSELHKVDDFCTNGKNTLAFIIKLLAWTLPLDDNNIYDVSDLIQDAADLI